MKKIISSEITPEKIYLSRRKFMIGIGAVATTALVNGCSSDVLKKDTENKDIESPPTDAISDEKNNNLTPYSDIISYNNFYEFTTDKEDVAELTKNFKTQPWTVKVGGLVNKPKTFSVDELVKKFKPKEKVYRLRCVEGWSMVIPWLGFSLAKLLKEVEPTSKAKYVKFQTLYDPAQMPAQKDANFQWPYIEGLRLDEAMNELTLLSNGLYGRILQPQNGAPLRLVVPWKYGFKSIKSIVSIELVSKIPVSLWMNSAPDEYGFFANVNPNAPHPRWSQSSERLIGEFSRRQTLPFNGYEEQVADLYKGMDLIKNF